MLGLKLNHVSKPVFALSGGFIITGGGIDGLDCSLFNASLDEGFACLLIKWAHSTKIARIIN